MTGEVNEEWEKVKLGDVVEINKKSIDKNFLYKEIEYIDISSVGTGQLLETAIYGVKSAPSRARRLVNDKDTMGSGTIFKSVTKADMYGLKILVPPETLRKGFEEIIAPIFAELKNLIVRNVNLRHTRDLLLPKLISGEVDELKIETGGLVE